VKTICGGASDANPNINGEGGDPAGKH
jgi:hypothetical protein